MSIGQLVWWQGCEKFKNKLFQFLHQQFVYREHKIRCGGEKVSPAAVMSIRGFTQIHLFISRYCFMFTSVHVTVWTQPVRGFGIVPGYNVEYEIISLKWMVKILNDVMVL